MDPKEITKESIAIQDTDAQTDHVLFCLYRRMTLQQKAERLVTMWRVMQSLAEAQIRSYYPTIEERELRLRVGSRRIPRELMIEAFGWDPLRHGY